jgi:hypothetical protein
MQLALPGHALLHAPQCASSNWRSTQRAAIPVPQVISPAGHIAGGAAHMPARQLSPAAQRRPHAPQFAASVAVLTQRVPQRVLIAGHIAPASFVPVGAAHTPARHVCPAAHRRPHIPQLLLLT